MTLLIGFAIRSAVLLALGLLLRACLARRSAALRHRVLAASLLGAALVLPFNLALPAWTLTLPAPVNDAGAALVSSVSPAARSGAAPGPALQTPPTSSAVAISSAPASVSPFVVVWLGGVVVVAGMLAAGLVRVRGIAARASRVDDERWLHALEMVANRFGLRRRIVICRTESPDLLATWGMLRPHILVPRHARDWPLDRVQVVLSHELAHIRRHDWLVQIGAELLRALLWFNPLAWMVCTRLRRESEQACDDEVLGMGVGARDYAAHLLDLARQCRRPGFTWVSALPMAHPSTLERRITAMLNPRLDRQAPSRRVLAALIALLVVVALPVAALRARQAGPAPLTGTIYDVSGGVLPGVQVTLVGANEATAVATTTASGRFAFPPVGPGKYVLEVALPGFRMLRQELELRDARDWDRAVTLQVGEVQETVTVRASHAAPSHEAASRQAVRVGGNVKPPLKIKDVRPTYPDSMREAGLTGVVPLQAIIGRDGIVSSVRVLSAQIHPDLAGAAIDAVRQWRFTPTLLNGQPVEVVMTVSVRFDLE